MEKIILDEVKNGILCFTFDDRNFEGWINALPIFRAYRAHASFFISGEIDNDAILAAKILHKAGHTIGLHSKNHANAPEYFEAHGGETYYKCELMEQKQALESCGIEADFFAYPNNRRNEETDSFLGRYFTRFRAGNTKCEQKYIPVAELNKIRVMAGFPIGEYYNTTAEGILDIIAHASKENLCASFFSHNIEKNAQYINMPAELLEKSLSFAASKGLKVLGFNELP